PQSNWAGTHGKGPGSTGDRTMPVVLEGSKGMSMAPVPPVPPGPGPLPPPPPEPPLPPPAEVEASSRAVAPPQPSAMLPPMSTMARKNRSPFLGALNVMLLPPLRDAEARADDLLESL